MAQRTLWILVGLVLLVAVGAGGFFLGTRYGSARAAAAAADRAAFLQQRLGNQGQVGGFFGAAGPGGGNPANFGGARGTVESVDGDRIVVNGPQGPVTVHLTETTRIFKSVEGTSDDLKTGEAVAVTGERNADGSLNANSIVLQPSLNNTSNP